MSTPGTALPLRFGRFELQPQERRLLVEGEPAVLGARAFDLLLALAERPGRLVTKAELMDLVWPGLVVQENNLAAQMSLLRKLLGEGVVATIPGRGYRFVATLETAAAPVPAAAPPPALRTNLPAALRALFGRADDLAALGTRVDTHRLVSVVGAGGVGKSLLAQHVLAARRERYPHGVCWVELAAVTEAAALPGAVAAALGVEVGQGAPDALAALAAALAPLGLLLALDNAEHLLADVARLARALHDAAPGLRLLVTSQAALRLPDEQVFRLGPLAVPAEAPANAEEALRHGAVALFADRAQALDHRWRLADADVPHVARICRALDGLPLALELAAARAPLLGAARLHASLGERFALLTQGRDRAAPARQRTLRGALEWSHALLEEREQRVFRRLGVFAGSAPLPLLQQVLADPAEGLDGWAVLDALDTLVDRSLVALHAADGDADADPRYRLLETPRAFALEGLQAAGERAALQRRHAQAVAALFDAAYEEYFSGRVGVDEWLHRREADLDDAREALQWARAAGDAECEMRIACTLLRALPPSLHAERLALADACEARVGPALPEALQLRTWIELNCVLADPQKARGRAAAEQGLALARRLQAAARAFFAADRFVLYHLLSRAASAAAQTDDLATARVLLQEAQALEDPAWPPQRRIWGAEAAQWVARIGGEVEAALRHGRRLLALDRERGSHAAIAVGNLVDAELAAGHAAAAAQLGAGLVASLQGTRHAYTLAFARVNLLAALLAQDDAAGARPVAQAAWSTAPAFELQHAAAAYLALLCALEGRPRAAVQVAAFSEALYAARQETREANETAATQRALAIAGSRLDAPSLAALNAAGAHLDETAVGTLAFATEDSA